MKAVIMAGGEGTRLRPLTCNIPKPMVPIQGIPVMEHIINLLKDHNINEIAATLWYLPEVIIDYFGEGNDLGVNLKYFIEEKPLGTGGSVKNANSFLDDTFVVISGDAVTNIDISKALAFHKEKKAIATIVLKHEPIPLSYGIVITNEEDQVVRFLEKPSWGEVFSDTINTGIYILEPSALSFFHEGENFDFSKDLFPKLLKENMPIYGYITNDYWCDIGDFSAYKQTHFDILDKKISLFPKSSTLKNNIHIGKGSIISDKAQIFAPAYIGDNCIINDFVQIGPYSFIGDNCQVDVGAHLDKTLLWNDNLIGKNTFCKDTIICNNTIISNDVSILTGSVVGAKVILEPKVIVNPKISIWPNMKVEGSTNLNHNLVWGYYNSTIHFEDKSIIGILNQDITLEFASLLGSVLGTLSDKAYPIVIGNDEFNTSKLIKQAVSTGLVASGLKVIDISKTIKSAIRDAVTFYSANKGIYIKTSYNNQNKIQIEFISNLGGDIDRKDEKNIELQLNKEEFSRCNYNQIKDIDFNTNYNDIYLQKLLNLLTPYIKNNSFKTKILITSKSEHLVKMASYLFEKLGLNYDITHPFNKSSSKEAYISYVTKLIKVKNYDLGFLIDENNESITIVDKYENVTTGIDYILLTALLSIKYANCKNIILPHVITKNFNQIATKYNTTLQKCKASNSDFLNELLKSNLNNNDTKIQYLLNFNPITAIALITIFLSENNNELKTIQKEIPLYYLKKSEINCDFNERGRIIRKFIETNKNKDIELYEGIKINTKNGWTLILPDNEKPILNLYSEGYSEEYADELTYEVIEKIENLLKSK